MPIIVADQGTISTTGNPSLDVSGSYVNGSLIFIEVYEQNVTGVAGTFSDGLNTWTKISTVSPNNDPSLGTVSTWYAYNVIETTDPIYTLNTSGVFCAASSLYANGVQTVSDPLDTAAGRTATGSGTAMLVTSGTLVDVGGELMIGAVGWSGAATDTFTQDPNSNWVDPPDLFKSGAVEIAGAYTLRPGTTAPIRYSPSISVSRPWCLALCGFRPEYSPFSVFPLGTFSDTVNPTVSLTGINVPPGAMIFLVAFEKNFDGQVGTYSDTSGNVYRVINDTTPAGVAANGTISTKYVYNAKKLTNGTITYNKTAGVVTTISAFYATGVLGTFNPLDSGLVAGGFGTGFGITKTMSGQVSQSYELVVAVGAWVPFGVNTFSLDEANAVWQTVNSNVIDASSGIGVNVAFFSSGAPITGKYQSFLNASRPWGCLIQSFFSGTYPAPPPDDTTLGANDA